MNYIDQHPIIFHYLFSAYEQIHAQQVFRSESKFLAHLISAIILLPTLSKAAVHAIIVF